MALLDFMVRGTPTTAGSKTALPIYKGSGEHKVFTGRHTMVDGSVTPEAKAARKSWRGGVLDAAVAAVDAARQRYSGDDPFPLDFPLSAGVVFTLRRPDSHFGSGRNRHLVKPSAPHRPMGRPDLLKYLRAVEDELTNAGVWRDDSRVVSYFALAKVYVNDPWDSIGAPGVRVVIRADTSPAVQTVAEQQALAL